MIRGRRTKRQNLGQESNAQCHENEERSRPRHGRSGWAWKGAGEGEISRDPKDYPRRVLCGPLFASWKDDLKHKFDWACVVQCDKNTDEEIHLNGLSVNDME